MFRWFERFTSFHRVWKALLETDAKVYTGLYAGLKRIADKTAKKPEKILKEWCIRTENKFGSFKANDICRKTILPLTETKDKEACGKTAARLLSAAKAANIHCDCTTTQALTEDTAAAYIDLNDNELFAGDPVEVISPAWFQNGRLIEQGYCKRAD